MYTIVQDYSIWLFLAFYFTEMIILDLLVFSWCWCELVHPVPMLTVDWLCYSLLLIRLLIDPFLPFFLSSFLPFFLSSFLPFFLSSFLRSTSGRASTNRVEKIFPKYLSYYVYEIARKHLRVKKYSSSFYDSVAVGGQSFWEKTRGKLSIEKKALVFSWP